MGGETVFTHRQSRDKFRRGVVTLAERAVNGEVYRETVHVKPFNKKMAEEIAEFRLDATILATAKRREERENAEWFQRVWARLETTA